MEEPTDQDDGFDDDKFKPIEIDDTDDDKVKKVKDEGAKKPKYIEIKSTFENELMCSYEMSRIHPPIGENDDDKNGRLHNPNKAQYQQWF